MTTKPTPRTPVPTVITPIEDVRNNLDRMKNEFSKALPPQISVEKFTRVAMTAIQAQQDLLQVDRKSLFGEIMKCAADGLLPDGREATIQVYRIKGAPTAKYMPMISGILKKVRNSGELATITSQMIYENDKFRYWIDDDGEHVEHEPQLFGDRGKKVGVYALAKTKAGEVYIEAMNEDQVVDVKNTSKAKEAGPWSGVFETEMWRKTVVRRLSKRLPMSTDLEEVIRRDDDLYDVTPANKGSSEKKTTSSRLTGLIETKIDEPSQEGGSAEPLKEGIPSDPIPTADEIFNK